MLTVYNMSKGSLSQNPVGFRKSLGKSGLKPAFSGQFRAAFPKTEVLGKPQGLYNELSYQFLRTGLCSRDVRYGFSSLS
jgi:hypothetical protein